MAQKAARKKFNKSIFAENATRKKEKIDVRKKKPQEKGYHGRIYPRNE